MKFFISEFIGTFIIVLSVLVTSNPLFIAAAFLCAIILTAGDLNPIVTMAMVLSGKLKYSAALEYLIGQVLGGAGAFLIYSIYK